jgi:hypothetical protein
LCRCRQFVYVLLGIFYIEGKETDDFIQGQSREREIR